MWASTRCANIGLTTVAFSMTNPLWAAPTKHTQAPLRLGFVGPTAVWAPKRELCVFSGLPIKKPMWVPCRLAHSSFDIVGP